LTDTVELTDVSKHYGPLVAVNRLSFTVSPGETIALLGPSGCGKTTTLRLIAGFETPDAGTLRLAGEDVARKRPYERSIGLLFQHYALFPHMSVADNIAYGLRHRGFPRQDIPRLVAEMLALVKLSDKAAQRPGQMSGGQQQRVALARALATQPKVVLLDEPLSALDAKLRQELRVELKQVLASVRATTIVVTHDQEEAMSLAERIIVMNHGAIAQQGTPDEIYSRPNSRFVAEFMGRSNWFAGRISGQSGAGGLTFATASGITLRIPAPAQPHPAEVDVCIRPERIDLAWGTEAAEAAAVAPNINQVAGRVAGAALLGADRQFLVELVGGDRIVASLPNRLRSVPAEGEPVSVCFAAEDCIVVPSGV
jgi:ABC-type Fe3+/spermidine/putrescine transport system ATPase subunit